MLYRSSSLVSLTSYVLPSWNTCGALEFIVAGIFMENLLGVNMYNASEVSDPQKIPNIRKVFFYTERRTCFSVVIW